MPALRVLTTTTAPVRAASRIVAAVLDAPRAARQHPTSQELRRLLDTGFVVTAYRHQRQPVATDVVLERDDERQELHSEELAFAAYAAGVVPRAIDRALRHQQRRVLAR